MTPLLDAFDPAARLLVQALLNTLWPGFLLLGMVYLTLRVSGRTSAATRHAVWLVALLAFCALPALPTGEGRISIPSSAVAPPLGRLAATLTRPTSAVAPVEPAAFSPAVSPVASPIASPVAASSEAPAEERVRVRTEPRAEGIGSGLVGMAEAVEAEAQEGSGAAGLKSGARAEGLTAWLLGGPVVLLFAAGWALVAAFLLARIIWSYIFLLGLRRQLGLMPAAERVRGHELAEIYGLRRRVRFFTSPLVGVPMTMGWLRPLVILPPDVVRTLSAAELDSILAHELAHILRWDYLINLLQRVAQALFFFHPAVWIIGRELAIERELACDDWALKLTGEPRRYATCLTKMVEVLGGTRPLAAATGIIFGKHVISRRIEMILNGDRNATTSVSKTSLVSAFGAAGLAVAMCTFFAPVIAVPRAESGLAALSAGATLAAQSEQARPATPAPRPVAPVAPDPAPAPLLPALAALLDSDDLAETPEPALAPLADEPVFELLDTPAPVAIAPHPATPARAVSLVNYVDYAGLLARSGQQPPVPVVGREGGSQPLIPESELLAVLTDIVKRDTDPNVRQEALRGIYRIRTEAGASALLSLYDTIPDVKTKSEIIEYLMRREGDNSKAIAKLVQIARTEKDETLRGRALRQLSRVKGDDGATHLISIYDSLQDPKEKQLLIRYLGQNKSRKAVDKLIQIAKNDADPGVRQSAIRSLYAIDHNLYLDVRRGVGNVSEFKFDPKSFALDGELFNSLNEAQESFSFKLDAEMRERAREAMENQREEIERAREALEELREKRPEFYQFWPETSMKLQPEARKAKEKEKAKAPSQR